MKQPMASNELIQALRRKRGELNYTTEKLAEETEVSAKTLSKILKNSSDKGVPVRKGTLSALNEWLYQQV